MKEKREIISQIAEFLSYKIRSGAVSQEGGDKIWRVALEHPEGGRYHGYPGYGSAGGRDRRKGSKAGSVIS